VPQKAHKVCAFCAFLWPKFLELEPAGYLDDALEEASELVNATVSLEQ